MRAVFRAGLRPAVLRLYDPFDTWVALREGEAGEDVPPPTKDQLRRPSRRAAEVRRVAVDMALSRPRALKAAADLAKGCLMVAVHEGEDAQVRDEEERTRAICAAQGARDLGDAPGRRWLHTRYAVSYKLPSMFEAGAWVDTCEVATGWAGVEALYEAVREAVAPHAFVMAHFSHAYPDGCSIYFTFSGAAIDPEKGEAGYHAAWKAALDAADAQGATITHHHGVGLLKAPWLPLELGRGGVELYRAAKSACDPDGILNPGKLLP
jgi:alkyldihydroxyacetonephosphate synthase